MKIIKKAAAGWEFPLLTFIYPGFDCGSIGLVWILLDWQWLDLVRFGLEWFEVDWFGLVWTLVV